jgi:hypothetical protein
LKLEKTLKWIGLVITFIGLLLGYLDLKGFFSHPDRVQMVQAILKNGKAESDQAAFPDFLKEYPPPINWQKGDIKGIAPLTSIRSGGVVTATGPLIYFGVGKQTGRITTFKDLEEWANKSSYPWVSWVTTVVGWLICALGLILESFEKKE